MRRPHGPPIVPSRAPLGRVRADMGTGTGGRWHNPGMRAVAQRVARARVVVDGEVVGECGRGLLVLVGVTHEDTEADAVAMASKLVSLRIFPDDDDRMNRSLIDVGGGLVVVSQFTLYGDVRRGRRPGFDGAAAPDQAEPLIVRLVEEAADQGVTVATGRFGARMAVELTNDGPVTLILESAGGRVT